MKRKIIWGAVLLFVLVTIFGVLPMSMAKRVIAKDAVKIVELNYTRLQVDPAVKGPVFVLRGGAIVGISAGTATLTFTNTTTNWIELQFVSLQAGGSQWTNYYAPFAQATFHAMLGPQRSTSQNIEFQELPPPRPWRFRIVAKEKLRGKERPVRSEERRVGKE